MYAGDKIEFQNAFGAWMQVNYRCIYDLKADRAINLELRYGPLFGGGELLQ